MSSSPRLRSVSYYRLSGYSYTFRENGGDNFQKGTTLQAVWSRYTFDHRFRLIVMDAIERVEILWKSAFEPNSSIASPMSRAPSAMPMPSTFPIFRPRSTRSLLHSSKTRTNGAESGFIQHFRATYGTDHPMPPYWMITELITFGSLLTLCKGSPTHIKKVSASRFGVGDNVLQSWLGALNVVRNICAHHSRLVRRVCPEQARERAGLDELGRNSSDKIRGRKLSLKVVTNQSKKAVASGAQSSWCFSLRRRLCDRIHQAPIKEIIDMVAGFGAYATRCSIMAWSRQRARSARKSVPRESPDNRPAPASNRPILTPPRIVRQSSDPCA